MTRRRPKRQKNGRFTSKRTPGTRQALTARSPAETAEPVPISWAVPQTRRRVPEESHVVATDDRPACFGNCYEGSSACDACASYNSCRRVSS